MAKAKTTASKKGNTLPVQWDEELAKYATAEAARTTASGGGEFLGTQGGKFQFQGEIIGDEIDLIVVDFVHQNIWNPWPYDQKSKIVHPPGCFAYSEDGKDMEPHESAPDKQSESCETCPFNEFGSGKVGNSKECNGRRLLAVIHADSEDLSEAKIVGLSLSPNALKPWDGYVSNLAGVRRRPQFSVVTHFEMQAKGTYHIVVPKFGSDLDRAQVEQIIARREEARAFLLTPPNVTGYEPYAGRPAKGKTAAKGKSAFSKR